MTPTTAESSPSAHLGAFPDVLTSAEAAEYLRVAHEDVIALADRGELPGRKIKDEWRFARQALCEWLSARPLKERLLRHAGAAKNDPYLEQILERIYRDRGRPMVDGEE